MGGSRITTFIPPGQSDGNGNGVQDDIENTIAQKFTPILHRHYYDKQNGLENVDNVLDGYSTLVGNYLDYEEYNEDIPPLHVNEQYNWDSFGIGNYIPFIWRIDIENSIRHSGASQGERPLYFHIYSNNDGYCYLQYWYFFNMNDLRYHNQTKNDTWHEGDWEHVSLKLELLANNDYQPVAINFYQHLGGHTRTPEECWWSSSNSSTYTGIQQSYDEDHTHLHIWLAANAHASYNRYDKVYNLEVEGGFEDYTDNVDYSPSGYDLYFPYDYLENMGEILVCYYCTYHDQTWTQHRMPRGPSKEWLAFIGYFGDWWRRSSPPVTHTYSPKSPANNRYWRDFTYNSLTDGFGNELGFFGNIVVEISWVNDPSAGDAPSLGKPSKEI